MKTLVLASALLWPTLAFAGSVHGTILYERESGNWVKVPGPIEVELRSQVAESRRVEVRNGEFSFSDVPQGGGYEIWVSPPKGLRSLPVQNICVGPGVLSVELKLRLKAYHEMICVPCRGTLEGRAVDSQGRPARGLAVTLLVDDKHFAAARTRRNGTFLFKEVPEFRTVTVEIAPAGLPVFRSTFEYRDPLSAFLQEPTPDQTVRELVLPDCPLPRRQPDSSLQPTPQAPVSSSIRETASARLRSD